MTTVCMGMRNSVLSNEQQHFNCYPECTVEKVTPIFLFFNRKEVKTKIVSLKVAEEHKKKHYD